MAENEPKLTLSVEEAAKLAGVSRALGYDQARRGLWPVVRCGRRLLVSRAVFLRYLNGEWHPARGNGHEK